MACQSCTPPSFEHYMNNEQQIYDTIPPNTLNKNNTQSCMYTTQGVYVCTKNTENKQEVVALHRPTYQEFFKLQ